MALCVLATSCVTPWPRSENVPAEEPMVTENVAKVLDPGASKPATPRTYTEEEFRKNISEEVSKATSKFQKQAASANNQVKTLQGQISTLTEKIAQAEEEAKVARLAGDDEEEGAKIRERMRFEKQVTERESRVLALERKHTIKALAEEYGIPEEDLEGLSTAAEMEGTAKDYALKAAREENIRLKEGANSPDEPKKPGFDTGRGKAAPPPQDIMKLALSKDPKDQAAFEVKVAEAMRRR